MGVFDKVKKIVYLSSTDDGVELLKWLKTLDCDIVLSNTENKRITEFPQYDLGVSYLYSHKIPASEFAIPHKWVNFHPAPLPKFRGRNCAYHAIMEDSNYFGATIHYMDEDFDTGDLIEVCTFSVIPFYTAGDLMVLSHSILYRLFRKYMPQLLERDVDSYPQGSGYYYKKTSINNKVDLTYEQQRKIRAVTALPRFYAVTEIDGRKYKLVPLDNGE